MTDDSTNIVPGTESQDKPKKKRIARGLATAREAFFLPILSALTKFGGNAHLTDVMEYIEQELNSTLNEADKQHTDDTMEARWRKSVQWAKWRLLHSGLVTDGPKRGFWCITDAGREAVAKGEVHALTAKEIYALNPAPAPGPDQTKKDPDPTPLLPPPNGANITVVPGPVVHTHTADEIEDAQSTKYTHSQIQYLLASLGAKLGCQVWIARNDHSRTWNGQTLGDLSLPTLPPLAGMDDNYHRIISLIDVLWLHGPHQVVAAFEVEHTTSIYSGLLRLADLVVQSYHFNIPLYIVAPESRIERVRRELARPAFRKLQLPQYCGFFSDESLVAEAESIKRWATDHTAITRLAQYLPDIQTPGITPRKGT